MSARADNGAGPGVCIGLEVHARLDTRTKLFCACPNEPLGAPNAATCPVCVGLPGALPTLGRAAVEQALRIALRLGCDVAERLTFDRKHYAYPDLPKGYQITQARVPLGRGGSLALDDAGGRRVALRGMHLEEDAGRSRHDAANTLVDFGRAGVPLVEIVTEPVLRSAEEVRAFLTRLRDELRFVGAATCDMERGDMRVDVNVSLAVASGAPRGTRIELKNLNSIQAAYEAVGFETERLARLGSGVPELQDETRGWNAEHRRSYPLRPKEHATDYRMMPEPDLVSIALDRATLAHLAASLPPRPAEHRARLAEAHGLGAADVAAMTRSPRALERFERLVAAGLEPQRITNWLTNNQTRLRREVLSSGRTPVRLTDERLGALLLAWQDGRLTREGAEAVGRELIAGDGRTPEEIARALGLWRAETAGDAELSALVTAALEAEPAAAADFRAGKHAALMRLVGHVMRAAHGRFEGARVREAMRAAAQQPPSPPAPGG